MRAAETRHQTERSGIGHGAVAYLLATLVALAAIASRAAMDTLVTGVQFITFFPAVIIAAYAFGTRPGLLAALLCGTAGWYLFLQPFGSFRIERAGEALSLAVYFLISGVMAVAVGGFRAATARERRTIDELKQSEERLRAVVDQMPVGVVIARVPDGAVLIYNRKAEELLGHPVLGGDARTYGDYGGLDADGEPIEATAYPVARAVLTGEVVTDEEMLYRRGDGTLTHLLISARRIDGQAGGDQLVVCTFTDISQHKRHEQHQRLLIDELNHRVKNTLAIVQSLAQQTLKSGAAGEDVRRNFEGRLLALSAAHDVLTNEGWAPASIEAIFGHGLQALGIDPGRVTLGGPAVSVPPQAAVSFAMAFHELATNAIKYGSLSVPEGRVELRWRVEGDRLRIEWRESGGPPVTAPARRGFGSRLIERALAGELGGETRLDFRAEGLVCTIDAPLPRQES